MHPSRDTPLAELAREQGGPVSGGQLRDLGLSPSAVKERVRSGRLHRLHRDVFAVGHIALTPRGHAMAAVLAGGPGAAASHRSSGALLAIRPHNGARHDVTTRTHRRSTDRIAFHRNRLHPDDVTEVDGVPCTTVARTLLDLADVVTEDQLAKAVQRAQILRILDQMQVADLLARANGRRGAARLRTAAGIELPPTRSEFEDRFLALLRRARLPRPLVNVQVLGYEVDFHWPEQRLIVETDGFATHGTRRAFEDDRARDLTLTAAGWRVVRITWRHLIDAPHEVEDALRALLRG